MIQLRAMVAISLVAFLAAGAIADESDQKDLSCEYPAKDANYASVTELIISGRCEVYRGPLVIYVKDSNNVVHSSVICHPNAAAQGAWSCRSELPRHSFLKPGDYTLEAIPVAGPHLNVPIRIIHDPSGPAVPVPLPLTSPDSKDFKKLPLLKLKLATLSSLSVEPQKLPPTRKNEQSEVTVAAENEIAVEGGFRTLEIPNFPPPEVVIRLTAVLIDNARIDRQVMVIVGETLVPSIPTDDAREFQYHGVLRVPNRVGNMTLEAVHCGKVIASSPMAVRPPKPVSEAEVMIEHPSEDTVYLTSSEIVVSGTAKLFDEKVFIDLQDKEKIEKSVSDVLTGDERSGGAWATRLYFQKTDVRNPGPYQLIVRPIHARQQSLSIKMIADPGGSNLPTAIQTVVGSEDYERLQRLQLARVTIQSPDDEHPQVTFREQDGAIAFTTLAGREFAVEGTLSLKGKGEKRPSNVILRLTGVVNEAGGEPTAATVNESIARYDGAERSDYPFRTVLRAPDFAGTFTVETIYRRQVIASSTMKVRPRL